MHSTVAVRRFMRALLLMSSLVLLVLVAAGCSAATSANTSSARPTATKPVPITGTAVASPTVPPYFLPNAPLLPVGWSWYRNDIGHFQVPLAPGWGVGTFYGDWTPQAEGCTYRIQFFPPGTAVTPSQASAVFAPRLIEIDVNLNCPPPPWSITPDHYDVQEPTPILVDGQQVIMWDNDDLFAGHLYHFGLAAFHGHQFEFILQSRLASANPGDLKTFLEMLHGFQYTGK